MFLSSYTGIPLTAVVGGGGKLLTAVVGGWQTTYCRGRGGGKLLTAVVGGMANYLLPW